LTILGDYARRVPPELQAAAQDAAEKRALRVQQACDPFAELDASYQRSPAEEAQLIHAVWTQLFTKATRRQVGLEAVREVLEAEATVEPQSLGRMMAALLDEATAQLKALCEADDDAVPERVARDGVEAARQVQLRLAQLAASSRLPSAFA
jgi:hypothetical protein